MKPESAPTSSAWYTLSLPDVLARLHVGTSQGLTLAEVETLLEPGGMAGDSSGGTKSGAESTGSVNGGSGRASGVSGASADRPRAMRYASMS